MWWDVLEEHFTIANLTAAGMHIDKPFAGRA
jgi:hypothetical protein